MHILFFLLLLFLLVLLLVVTGIFTFIRRVLGLGRKSSSDRQTTTTTTSAPQKKKIFDSNEGEYVSFEEVDKNSTP